MGGPRQYTSLCASLLRGRVLEDLRVGAVLVDGLDSTEVLLGLVEGWSFDALVLGGATFAGFNVVDPLALVGELGVPVIVFSSRRPDMEATRKALVKHFPDWRERWRRYEALGELFELQSPFGSVFFEVVGACREEAERILLDQMVFGRTPEAVRIADVVAKGVSPVIQGRGGVPRGF